MVRIMCYQQLLSARAFISSAHHVGSWMAGETVLSIDGLKNAPEKLGSSGRVQLKPKQKHGHDMKATTILRLQ